MPLKRHSHKRDEDLRRTVGRWLHTVAQVPNTNSRRKAASQTAEAMKIAMDAKDDKKADITEPASGTFSRRFPLQQPRARVYRNVWVPVNVSLAETEERMSRLFETKDIPENARQMVQDVLSVVERDNLLGGYSATVSVCAVAFLVGTLLGMELLSKPSIAKLPIRTDAVAYAMRALALQGQTLAPVVDPHLPEDRKKGEEPWIWKPVRRAKAVWSPPGPSGLREVVATQDISEEEHQEALRQIARAEDARNERKLRGEQFGGRPRRAARKKH